MKKYFFLFLLIITNQSKFYAQSEWRSSNYNYSLEIPKGFTETASIGQNVDFKAGNGENSIVVVIKDLPKEYKGYNIWEIMGDLSTYEAEWEAGANEYLENPDLLKYGKTQIDGEDCFWYDYTVSDPPSYSKVYQIQKNGKIFTFTLTSSFLSRHSYTAIWYRFKNKIQFL